MDGSATHDMSVFLEEKQSFEVFAEVIKLYCLKIHTKHFSLFFFFYLGHWLPTCVVKVPPLIISLS